MTLLQQQSAADQVSASVPERILRILRAARLVWPVTSSVVGVLAMLVVALAQPAIRLPTSLYLQLMLLAGIVTIAAMSISAVRLRRQLLRPLAQLEASVARVCHGEPGATLSNEDTGVLAGMVEDIDSINEELTDLYEDMDSRVARHTTRLAQKTASLKILYDVAASINQAQDLDALLLRYLRVLKEMVNGLAATVRLMQPDGRIRLVGSIGLDNELLRESELLPLSICPCGMALSPGDVLCQNQERHCIHRLGRRMFSADEVESITVSLDYHDEALGSYTVYLRKPGVSGREDIVELLETIGNHLGMAVAKQHSDREARRLSIMEERTALAHELHDSLAQTLASLRFQVRLLQDVLQKATDSDAACADLQRIRNGLDEAHTELRELLNSFRAPVEQRGLISALEKLVVRFQQETGTHSLFHQECRELNLSSGDELQIIRIAQECLANIRKHAQAHTVRVLLSCRSENTYVLLIEDDGVGFEQTGKLGQPGEHIGLSIMDERARRLGGTLRIESEPGEGTRVELVYQPKVKRSGREKHWIV